MATEEEQLQVGRDVSRYFTRRPGVEFVGFAGLGRHGGAILLEEKNAAGQLLRKLVIKYSLGELASDEESDADDDLRNEYEWLEMLRGAEHIVRLVPFADCSLDLPGISNGEDTFEDSVAQNPRIRRCPTFALEHIPNGTLLRFTERLQDQSQLIPNRMMWRIWLCMVRQCVAMAFPPQKSEEDYSLERERIIPNRRFYTLTQNSPHLNNFLFAEESPISPDNDHDPGVPPVKVSGNLVGRLIDFGRGITEDLRDYLQDGLRDLYECGYRTNIHNAAQAMMCVACPLADDEDLDSLETIAYHYTKDNRNYMVMTYAPPALTQSSDMDLALRDIIARCMAKAYNERPSLQEVLAEAEDKVANRGPNDDPWLEGQMGVGESDAYIRQFIQRFIYNASNG